MSSERSKRQRTSTAGEAIDTLGSPPGSKQSFVDLPLELHLMILRAYPIITEEDILVNPLFIELPATGLNHLDRFRTTRALSQTCRRLRALYLPICWERMQSCMRIQEKFHWSRDFSLGLQTQAEGLLRMSPYLLSYIRTVTVCLTRVESSKSLPLFVELLENLPNLESIQVPHAHGNMAPTIQRAFSGRTLPSVRSVILPNSAGPILHSCPNVLEVVCNEYEGARLVTSLIEAGCNKVEVLRGITPSAATLKRFARINPPLRRVRIGSEKDTDVIKRFSCFPSLQVIEIDCCERYDLKSLPSLVQAAKETLQTCSTFDSLAKGVSARAKKEAAAARERLANLHPGSKLVRVRYLPGQRPMKDFPHEDPSYFFPSRIEEHIV